MSPTDNKGPLKITSEDLENVVVPETFVPPTGVSEGPGAKSYGTITDAADKAPEVAEEHGSILL